MSTLMMNKNILHPFIKPYNFLICNCEYSSVCDSTRIQYVQSGFSIFYKHFISVVFSFFYSLYTDFNNNLLLQMGGNYLILVTSKIEFINMNF